MTRTEARKIASKVAWGFLGLPYVWGGDDAVAGFDCSGFCIEVLKSVGILPRRGDWTASGLLGHFKDEDYHVELGDVREGCLVFWSSRHDRTRIIHVELALNGILCIGASGGGSRTDDRQAAVIGNAYVKVRPWATRGNVYGAVDPFMSIPSVED